MRCLVITTHADDAEKFIGQNDALPEAPLLCI
jgi:hypothetical protein